MKKFGVVMGICLLSLTASTQTKKIRDIIGHWEIAGEQNAGASLQIIDSSAIVLNYMGERRIITDYKIDFTKSPIWFDFSTKDSSSTLSIKSLLQIIGDETIKWQLFIDEDRPHHFSSTKGEVFYLKKTRPGPATGVVSN